MRLCVVTWNLKHGRAVPPEGRELFAEFADTLAGWNWNVALLQEVPPWWPVWLGGQLQASARSVLTSRNSLLAARRAIARRRPDAIKSSGGGCNAILVRERAISAHRCRRLRWLPERRWLQAVQLADGVWAGNLHGGGSVAEAQEAGAAMLEWAGDAPIVLGGDFNIHALRLEGFEPAGGLGPDHIFVRGLSVVEPARALEHGTLSDHAPLLAVVAN